jgi:hypothetical protein
VLQWINKNNGTGNSSDRAWGIVVDSKGDENIYVTGYVTDTLGGENCATIKYNSAGNIQWITRFNGQGNLSDRAWGIVVDTDGSTYITGYTTSEDTITTDYMLAKYDSLGNEQWFKTFDGDAHGQDTAFAICKPRQSEYVFITGTSAGDTTGTNSDIVTIRYNVESGSESQRNIYRGVSGKNDAGKCIKADSVGNVYVAGYSEANTTGYDMLLIKFLGGDLIGLNVISTQVPKGFNLYQNYPNPFNPTTTIKFDIQKQAFVKLRIYDILGKEIGVLVNENLRVGTYEAVFGTSMLASGVYFYELTAGDYRDTKKMILVK